MSSLRLAALALLIATALAAPLAAQRNCTKGKPCGNTCIAVTSTCRKSNR